jgi:hypothetical protein
MPVAVITVRGVSEMSLDDLLLAITLAGLVLSGAYIRACFRESRMGHDYRATNSPPRPIQKDPILDH